MNEKEQEAAKVEINNPYQCLDCTTVFPAELGEVDGYSGERLVCPICDTGNLRPFGIQHSRLPADGWREINGVDDLPTPLNYTYPALFKRRVPSNLGNYELCYAEFPFTGREGMVDYYSHYKRITPPPTEKEER